MVNSQPTRIAELAITISYPTNANRITVLSLKKKKTPKVCLLQLNLLNFILNITKRSDIADVTSGKPRENHMTCGPFANLVG